MALVPRARHQAAPVGVRQVIAPAKTVAAQTGVGALAQGLSDVGDRMAHWQDEIDTAAAKDSDSQYSNAVRDLLYEDGTGFMNRMGGHAISGRDAMATVLKERRDAILAGLSGGAREKAHAALEGRYQAALQRINHHAASQRRTYLNDTANARIEAAINDAINDPAQAPESIRIAIQESRDAGARNGASPEVINGQIAEAQTQIHAGIVKRIAAASPLEAMRYLQDNKTKMQGTEVARLTASLMPAVREYKGRQIGRQAAEAGNWIRYANQDAIRDDPLSNRLTSALSFLPQMGITMEVFSGGQAAQGTPGAQRVGSTRHDRGHAADVFFYKDGRRLSWQDAADIPIFQEIVRRAKAAGVTGFGAGQGYMRPGSMHIGFGAPAVWGAGGKGAHAPGWLRDAYGDDTPMPALPGQPAATGMASLITIADPDERAAAMREFKLIQSDRRAHFEASRSAAADQAFRLIERGGRVDDLPIDFRQSLGREEMSALRAYQDKVAAGEKIETDPTLYVHLSQIASDTPNAFVHLNPIAWRDRLDDGDFEKFVDLQRKIRTEGREAAAKASVLVDAPTISALRTASKTALQAAGIMAKDNPQAIAQFERQLMQWADAFTRAGNKTPTPLEVNERINRMLTPIVLNPSGVVFGKSTQAGAAFQIDYDGNPLDPDDDLTMADLRGGSIAINGQDVETEILDRFIGGFKKTLGRNPTAQEVIDGLIESGLFQ